jgi:Arc/MetJ-type ribon-helix-helix transcriptional regulator
LTDRPACLNLSYMRATLTISLPPMLRRDVSRAAKGRHMTESEFVRDALRRRLALDRFYSLRERAVAQARARGIYTDEDVFKIVS